MSDNRVHAEFSTAMPVLMTLRLINGKFTSPITI